MKHPDNLALLENSSRLLSWKADRPYLALESGQRCVTNDCKENDITAVYHV